MTDVSTSEYSSTQRDAFGKLVKEGVYDSDFAHPAPVRAFFDDVMRTLLAAGSAGRRISVLDCGCGPGAWLAEVLRLAKEIEGVDVDVFGFDITPEMVEVCRQRFDGVVAPDHFDEGDILVDRSFDFPAAEGRFDIIFAYDVVQQLPRALQLDACRSMLSRLAPAGSAVVFDHDSRSSYGRKMGWKKFATQYLGLGLVPRYYCNAKYPPLRRFMERLEADGCANVELRHASGSHKCALVIGADNG
jgi:SAM-dependent methyltransferase